VKALRRYKFGLAAALALILIAGLGMAIPSAISATRRTHVTAYFENSNGIFRGDEVRILGVRVGKIDKIEPEPKRARISFWVDEKYKIPQEVQAVIISPTLVTARAIELTPAYTGGRALQSGALIPQDRTAVPVEWDDFRAQLQKLTDLLKPTQPNGVSTLGAYINTAADNLRGRGADIREAVIKLSQAISVLGDHSDDIFGTIRNLSILVSALHDSSDVLEQLNRNFAAVTGLLADDPTKIAQAVSDLNAVAGDVQSFVADNREALGTTTDKLASISQALVGSIGDIKQALHIFPNTFSNFVNIYSPSQGAIVGALGINNFSNPISFICGAIEAASRLGAQQASKLCVQYLAPIVKNRQINFPPIGENLFVGANARPNEVTYSEDWMRPEFVPPAAPPPPEAAPPTPSGTAPQPKQPGSPFAADSTAPPGEGVATDPSAGLPGLMVPSAGR
jgi:phospholipid/cholesterol/gamma-HCH transport system substrate-binding protein